MNYAEICIIKRDGKREDFSISKIKNAIGKAFHASGIDNEDKLIAEITMRVISNFVSPTISVEEIQDLVEKELMKVRPEVAKKYIIYREWRNTERDRKTQMKHIMDGIVAIDKNDVNLSNANMSSHTPAGQMMTFASEVTKDYTYKYLLPKKYAEAHQLGDIHIHDLDYYPTKTTTCIQYDLDDLFERGFRTKNGSIRTPQSIQSYATLATIIFQTNQNEQHGGQAIPAFDFFMAEGVRKTFRKHLKTLTEFYIEVEGKEPGTEALKKIEEKAYAMTRKDTHQAMEGFIHNLNTMHSRAGAQIPFSSLNYGTDTSPEGRLVMEQLLLATEAGLGNGETPIFPIHIFKVKEGVNYNEGDPNYDLFKLACRVSAKRMFPNFSFIDAPFNLQYYKPGHPETEVGYMGCRTRVMSNVCDPTRRCGMVRPRQPVVHVGQPAAHRNPQPRRSGLVLRGSRPQDRPRNRPAARPFPHPVRQARAQLPVPDGRGRMAGFRKTGSG